MYRYLQSILEDLDEQVKSSVALTKSSFRVLQNLNYLEKELVGREFIKWNWNVGSAIVLGWMQRANVLSASEFIAFKSEEDAEACQLVLNDLLETEFILLADLLRHIGSIDSMSGKFTEIISEAVQRLCNDLCEDSTLLQTNYLIPLKSYLTDDQMHESKLFHLKIFLEESDKNTPEEAIKNFRAWNKEMDESNTVFYSLLNSIASEYNNNTFEKILEFSKSPKFQCWKYYLVFLKYNTSDHISTEALKDMKTTAKGYVKSMFTKYLSNCLDAIFISLMLTARQICCSNNTILGTYSSWYKATIGEMKYTLKTEEFNSTMRILINMIEYENDPEILNIHINTAIPAPTFCNEIVLNFKQMCRSRLFYCTQKANKSNEDCESMDVCVLEDD